MLKGNTVLWPQTRSWTALENPVLHLLHACVAPQNADISVIVEKSQMASIM